MTFVRNLIADLVEKRLWPIALALVAAIVAVPVALGGGSAEGPKTAPRAIAAPAGARAAAVPADPAVTVSDPVPVDRRRSGRVRNPFEELRGGDDAPDAGTGAAAGSSGSGVGAASPGTGTIPGITFTGGSGTVFPQPGTGTGTGTGSDGSSGSSGKRDDALDVYRVDLRFGKPGELKVLRDVARLAPLPSADNPFFVFLGVLEDRETLVFLISSDVEATGDGKCRPSSKSCQTIELQVGDTEFFDFTQEDGSVIQYQMDVLGVDRRAAGSARAAAVSRARKSQVGQELLRMAAAENTANAFDAYRFRPDRGVLVRAKRKKSGARGASVRTTVVRTVGGRFMRGNRPRTLSRKGEVRVWRTRPAAAR